MKNKRKKDGEITAESITKCCTRNKGINAAVSVTRVVTLKRNSKTLINGGLNEIYRTVIPVKNHGMVEDLGARKRYHGLTDRSDRG